ncbi:unnamed protein product [Taenia asiatica]|uniref:CNNM transmembrane domain-containing protein n=1 Tax=Taenia asiatica TaxID=60517 RepID=A0A3P6NBQ5_TAEAS|nr:unnamed protein product [Taenia asiatica]
MINFISSQTPQLISYSAVPVKEVTQDRLILPQHESITFYLFGDNLLKVDKIAFAFKSGTKGAYCEDDKYEILLDFEKVDDRSIKAYCPQNHSSYNGEIYICFKHGNGNGTSVWTHQPTSYPYFFVFSTFFIHLLGPLPWVLLMFLLCCSALFSGLNLGIMTLDVMFLEILIEAGNENEKKMATAVLPVRRHGNLIICSLTLANVIVNVIISMLSDKLIGGTALAIFFASAGILLFGEILPQAACNRFSLIISYHTIFFTKLIMLLTFPIGFPISLVLNKLLGEDMGRTMNKSKLAELIKQHEHLGFVHKDELNIITGALNMDQRKAKSIMTPIGNVYMLPYNALLDYETTNDIISHGFTRIPIYKDDRRNITSVLNVKDLAFVDPKEKLSVSTICNFYNRPFMRVGAGTTLKSLFDMFRKESTHFAVVYEEEGSEHQMVVGIVTMEDVIEEILQEEIFDETDIINDTASRKRRNPRFHTTDLWPFFNHQSDGKISPQLKIAALRYLVANTTYFAPNYVHTTVLQGFLNTSFAVQHDYNHLVSESNTIYRSHIPSAVAIFVLQGTLQVSVHDDHLQFEAGAFMMFGDDLFANVNERFPQFSGEWNLERILQDLGDKTYFEPDYTVKMATDLRCLECTAEAYIVLRYLTQELEKCNLSDQNQKQIVELFQRFWKVRKYRGLKLTCDNAGVRILEHLQTGEDVDMEHSHERAVPNSTPSPPEATLQAAHESTAAKRYSDGITRSQRRNRRNSTGTNNWRLTNSRRGFMRGPSNWGRKSRHG